MLLSVPTDYVQQIMNDYKAKDSDLAKKFKNEQVWQLYKNKPREADERALNILRAFYATEMLYSDFRGIYLYDALEEIKDYEMRLKLERKEEKLHPIEPLRKIKKIKQSTLSREKMPLRERVLRQQHEKAMWDYQENGSNEE